MIFREPLINLFSTKLRSVLAILGILVGTAAVVALMTSSQLATDHAMAQFKKLGTNLLAMYIAKKPGAADTHERALSEFTLSDWQHVKNASKNIVEVAPYTSSFSSIFFDKKMFSGSVVGITTPFEDITQLKLATGRLISPLDHQESLCVVGNDLAKKFNLPIAELIGKQVRVGDHFFTIIGVLKKTQHIFFIAVNLNDSILVPIEHVFYSDPDNVVRTLIFRIHKNTDIDSLKKNITDYLQPRLPDERIVFLSPEQLIDIMQKSSKTYFDLLIAIGAISLVVGGIGVMNIMLVSVIERRREIGIRMAVGAKKRDILRLFLLEAVVLTFFGGTVGVVLGELVSYTLAWISKWGFHFYFIPVLLGFFVSTLVGIISGFYPAFRASKMHPIEALTIE